MENFPEMLRAAAANPHEFRRVVQRICVHHGWEAFSIDGPGDGGGDIILEAPDKTLVAVQSKWKRSPLGKVGPRAIHEVEDAYTLYDTDAMWVVTNASFTAPAIRYAKNWDSLALINGKRLKEMYEEERKISPEPLELRKYQEIAKDEILRDLDRHQRALLVMATGLGKTFVAGEVIREFIAGKPNPKILVTAHQTAIVEQLQRALWKHLPLSMPSQLAMTGNKPDDELAGLTVACVGSIQPHIDKGYRPDLLIVDECHTAGSKTYRKIIESLEGVPRIGMTATPWRSDGFAIETLFGEASYQCSILDGMTMNPPCLAELDYRMKCDHVDWDEAAELSTENYSLSDLNKRLFIPFRDELILDELYEVWGDVQKPKCIIFCASIKHAERMVDLLHRDDRWADAKLLHNNLSSQEKKLSLLDFRRDRCSVLVAVDMLNEGVDIPDVNIICFARVTHSRRIFFQQLGRGLRIAPEKKGLVVLDFAADLKRIKEVSDIRKDIYKGNHIEEIILRNKIEFSDEKVQSLAKEWLLDNADLENRRKDYRLSPPSHLDPDFHNYPEAQKKDSH
jgi:superfamily II DNA or RNA helicase